VIIGFIEFEDDPSSQILIEAVGFFPTVHKIAFDDREKHLPHLIISGIGKVDY